MTKLSLVKISITAKTKDAMTAKMFATNVKNGRQHEYSDPTFVKNEWVSWFYVDIENHLKDEFNKAIGKT